MQEVFRVTQVVTRIDHRLAFGVLEAHGSDGRDLGDQANRGDFAVLVIVDVQRVVIEGGQRAHHATHDSHRVCVATEAVEEVLQLLVSHGVALHGVDELFFLLGGRQFAVQQQEAGF